MCLNFFHFIVIICQKSSYKSMFGNFENPTSLEHSSIFLIWKFFTIATKLCIHWSPTLSFFVLMPKVLKILPPYQNCQIINYKMYKIKLCETWFCNSSWLKLLCGYVFLINDYRPNYTKFESQKPLVAVKRSCTKLIKIIRE